MGFATGCDVIVRANPTTTAVPTAKWKRYWVHAMGWYGTPGNASNAWHHRLLMMLPWLCATCRCLRANEWQLAVYVALRCRKRHRCHATGELLRGEQWQQPATDLPSQQVGATWICHRMPATVLLVHAALGLGSTDLPCSGKGSRLRCSQLSLCVQCVV
jgi:hypothetical protein